MLEELIMNWREREMEGRGREGKLAILKIKILVLVYMCYRFQYNTQEVWLFTNSCKFHSCLISVWSAQLLQCSTVAVHVHHVYSTLQPPYLQIINTSSDPLTVSLSYYKNTLRSN